MPESSSRISIAALLANTTWMHALARHLVTGEDAAEDLVQETWLRALRRGPRDPGEAKGWLATVLRNVSRSRTRAERRRKTREREVASREATESTADVVERVSVHQEVVDAVMALEEPVRRTILMRYFDGLPPREIARREGAPVDTIKGRLAKGLERLRRGLDSTHGGERQAWVVLLLPLARRAEAGAIGGATAVGLGMKSAAVIAALVLIALGIQHLGSSPEVGEIPEVTEGWKQVPPENPARVPIEVEHVASVEDSTQPEHPANGAEPDGAPRVEATTRATRFEPPATRGEWWTGEGPPGLVRIPGGTTQIGTSEADLIALLEANPQLLKNAGSFLSEIPRHRAEVDDFYLMVTEVTNEQYEAYVLATGVRPPHSWGEKAIAEAREAHLLEQGRLRKAAADAGGPPHLGSPFDVSSWWAENWMDAEWGVPERLRRSPVVYLDHQDACGYARWAGLRLVDEREFERAVRGDTDRLYPWDGDWEPGKHAATSEIREPGELYPVGSFPAGASRQGVFDLAGNVWEWTSSGYGPYPGWRHRKHDVGKGPRARTVDAIPGFRPDFRVLKGGSQQNSRHYSRCTTRGGFDRYQRASALGFRCAASTRPGLDLARSRLDELPREIRPVTAEGPVVFDTRQVLARHRWRWTDGTAAVPGYAVITGYDCILFTPAFEIPTSGIDGIRRGTRTDDLFYLGILSTTEDIVEPELEAGTYIVALRGRGQIPERKEVEEGAEWKGEDAAAGEPEKLRVDEHLALDVDFDQLIFIDMEGKPVAAMPPRRIDYVNPTPSTQEVVDRTIQIPAPGEEGKREPKRMVLTRQWLDLDLFIKGESRKGIGVLLSLRFAEGLMDENGWR